MDARGFFLSEGGSLTYDDNRCSYLDLEYWDGELKDEDRWAAIVSAHLKREINFAECANLLRFLEVDKRRASCATGSVLRNTSPMGFRARFAEKGVARNDRH